MGMLMEFFAGGDASDDVQFPQVAETREELEESETGRTKPQSEAEQIAIKQAEDDERRRQANKQGQQDTILTGQLGTPAEEDGAAQRKTLLGA